MNPYEGPGGGPLAEPQGRQKLKFSPKNKPPGIFLKVTWVVNFGTVSTVAAFIWRGSSYLVRKMRFEFRPNMGSLFYPPARSATEVPPPGPHGMATFVSFLRQGINFRKHFSDPKGKIFFRVKYIF
jgi:hypothetical protein